MTKAQRAKLKTTYRRDHPTQPPERPDLSSTTTRFWDDWKISEKARAEWEMEMAQHEEMVRLAKLDAWERVARPIEGRNAVAERVREKFQKQLVLRKAECARSKEIRGTSREKGERRTF
ncbi:hypothetical protein CLOM_g9661 [Closterium sp. NIES-68]|nr:hypothetical protein CLOM_g9661 [Closterium sp. NIES-68]GJP58505.1 hypothetical protein CLOP_g363 [Closterium sp. NIES-67]